MTKILLTTDYFDITQVLFVMSIPHLSMQLLIGLYNNMSNFKYVDLRSNPTTVTILFYLFFKK